MKKAAPKAQDADAKPYEPTPIEAKAIEAYRAAKEKRGPRLKMIVTGKDAVTIGPDHPDTLIGTIDLMRAIGTTDREFFKGLVGQLANASKEAEASERGLNFMLAVIKGIQPRDQIEAMLGAQMAAVHMASMTFARRLAHVDNIPQQDSAQTAFNKLARTFAAQVEALKRYRSGGEQKVTVQHVHVAEEAALEQAEQEPALARVEGPSDGQREPRAFRTPALPARLRSSYYLQRVTPAMEVADDPSTHPGAEFSFSFLDGAAAMGSSRGTQYHSYCVSGAHGPS